jgi:alkylhydroperoxidase family enzyme
VTGAPGWCLPDGLRALAPEAVERLDRTNACAWSAIPPALLEQVRLRIAALIGHDQGLRRRVAAAALGGVTETKLAHLDRYYADEAFTACERDVLEFTEQFVMDVSGPMTDYVALLETHFPGAVRELVTAVYVVEFTQRLEMVSGALLGPSAEPGSARDDAEQAPAAPAAGDLRQSLRDYQSAVMRGTALDPVITELVRLRCARTHNCRICQTLRLADARVAGADDAMTAKIDFYESSDLDERTKTALRITDAMITAPRGLSDAVIGRARSLFSPAELAELCLDITKWSTQKIHVALGTDGAEALPTNADGVSFLSFDAAGEVADFSSLPTSP